MSTESHSATLDLIAQLCLEAGRIMEDRSIDLALTLPMDVGKRTARLDQLQSAGADIMALAAAARAIHRRYNQG